MNIKAIADITGIDKMSVKEGYEFMLGLSKKLVMFSMTHKSDKLKFSWDYTKKELIAYSMPDYEIIDREIVNND